MPRTRVDYADWNITVYREPCPHACVYCWAWRVPVNAARITRGQYDPLIEAMRVARKAVPGERVVVSFTSDPYPPWEARLNKTRSVIYLLRKEGYATVMVLTKNPVLALKDIDVMLMKIAYSRYDVEAWLGTSITSADTEQLWSPTLEPGAPRTLMRLTALREYQRQGGRVWLSIEPIIPVNHRDFHPEEIVDAALRHLDPGKIALVVLGRLNYIPQIRKHMPFQLPSEDEEREYYRGHIPEALDRLREHGVPVHVKRELAQVLGNGGNRGAEP